MARGLFSYFLENDQYLQAAALQWGEAFVTEAESTQRAFAAMHKSSKVLFMGGSSMGKSFNCGIWMLLDFLRDPLYTSVKLTAVNEDQLRKQLFAHLAGHFKSCIIPVAYDIQIRDSDLWMGVKNAGYGFGIAGIAFKQSQETSGQLKGYKSQPVRRVKHPRFGLMSRLRILFDESQNYPGGPFQDVNSLVASVSGEDLVKIACAFNPENTSCHVVQLAEPNDGWDPDDLNRLYDYEAKSGWLVCRLDAALCENVKQKKIVYPGLQTYEGFMGYLKTGGDISRRLFMFCKRLSSDEGFYLDGYSAHMAPGGKRRGNLRRNAKGMRFCGPCVCRSGYRADGRWKVGSGLWMARLPAPEP